MLTFRFAANAVEDRLEVAVHSLYSSTDVGGAREEYLGNLEMTPFEWGRFYAALLVGSEKLGDEFRVVAPDARAAVKAVEQYLHAEQA